MATKNVIVLNNIFGWISPDLSIILPSFDVVGFLFGCIIQPIFMSEAKEPVKSKEITAHKILNTSPSEKAIPYLRASDRLGSAAIGSRIGTESANRISIHAQSRTTHGIPLYICHGSRRGNFPAKFPVGLAQKRYSGNSIPLIKYR